MYLQAKPFMNYNVSTQKIQLNVRMCELNYLSPL